jgi:Protein of unknown function (DUF1553)/Protein of unknown function (DUF1549)
MATIWTDLWLRPVSLGMLSLALAPALHGADQEAPALAARIDQRIAAAWGKSVKPAARTDDAGFFRRVHLDLAGRIPSITEIRDFLDDDRPDKRRLCVERILQGDPEDASYQDAYVNHFANVWRHWLLAQTNLQALFQQAPLEVWLRRRLRDNLGYDELVRQLLTQDPANGGPRAASTDGTAAAFYFANEFQPENLAGSTARLFLGVKLQCAQCHDHPFARWTRNQFWEYAAFFTDMPVSMRRKEAGARGQIKIMGTDRVVKARFPDGREPKWKDAKTRPTLVEWMTAADNPFFARAAVNRLWAHFFGIGLVDQLDAPGDDEAASHRELLDELAREFVAHKYDVKFLIRAIVASETYQRTSAASHPSQQNTRLLARMPLRGLSPEQLFDSVAVATEYRDASPQDLTGRFFFGPQSPRAQFLAKFPAQDQKNDYQTSILQALYLMNGAFIADQTSVQRNQTLATLADQRTSTARKVESLYLVVLSRKPRPPESERFVKYVDAGGPAGDPKKALADVFWVLLNSPEFILNH